MDHYLLSAFARWSVVLTFICFCKVKRKGFYFLKETEPSFSFLRDWNTPLSSFIIIITCNQLNLQNKLTELTLNAHTWKQNNLFLCFLWLRSAICNKLLSGLYNCSWGKGCFFYTPGILKTNYELGLVSKIVLKSSREARGGGAGGDIGRSPYWNLKVMW